MNDRVITAGALAIAVSSLALAAYAMGTRARPADHQPASRINEVADWRGYARVGQRDGPTTASVTIVMFTDYQCPACRRLARLLQTVRRDYPTEVAVVVRHFPLASIHPAARRAAVAAECAAEQGRFMAFQKVLYDRQDSLERAVWSELAGEAQIADATRLTTCIRDSTYMERVERDIRAGNELPVEATPTVLVNETLIVGVPPARLLDSLIRSRVSGNGQRTTPHDTSGIDPDAS